MSLSAAYSSQYLTRGQGLSDASAQENVQLVDASVK
jgi:hypothetical protein